MQESEEKVARKVSVDCPVCCTGNRFRLADPGRGLACEDCGFLLSGPSDAWAPDSGRCVFCGGEYFYVESPLSLPLLGKDSVCYVCEARYKGVRAGGAEQGYSPETFARVRESAAAKGWRERAERYNQGPG